MYATMSSTFKEFMSSFKKCLKTDDVENPGVGITAMKMNRT